MIKYIKHYLFLLLLLYNHLNMVKTQYKNFLHTTHNLLDSKYQQRNIDPLDSQLHEVDLDRIYKQLINKVVLRTNDARVHAISKRNENTQRLDNERNIPIGRRRVRKIKVNPIDKPDTSTDSNRDDGYYVTNIESTNVNKRANVDGKFDGKIGIDRKFEINPKDGENSLEQLHSEEVTEDKLDIKEYTRKNKLEKKVDTVENDEYGNRYNEMELNINGTDIDNDNKEPTGQTSVDTQIGNIVTLNGQIDKDTSKNESIGNGTHEDIVKSEGVKKENGSVGNNTSGENTSSETFKKIFATYPTPSASFFARKKDLLRNIVLKRCHNRYSFLCLKIDLIKIIDKLNTTDQFTILPGVQIVRHTNVSSPVEIPTSVILSILRNSTSPSDSFRLDQLLLEKLRSYLSQLSVSVKLLDTTYLLDPGDPEPTALSTESTGRTFFSGSWKDTLSNFMGRGKKQNYGHAAIWSAGTLAALAFAALAALSGKALITSILALILAAICAFKGHGHGHGGYGNYGYGKTSHYEIITKPAHYHDHEHLHSTNLAAAASPYASYARQLVTDRLIPTLSFDPESDIQAEPYAYGPHE